MLVQFLIEQPKDANAGAPEPATIGRLAALYHARARFDGDPAFADRARRRVVMLQSGDPESVARWWDIVEESTVYFTDVYARLGVRLTPRDAVGESFYNPHLADLADELEEAGIAVRSGGALCVFFDDIAGPDGAPVPLIVRKSDGGFGYAATDLAAIRYRVHTLRANRILYVVDARQALHFRMVFATAAKAGWIPPGVDVIHVPFGTVLGPDGRPFKTRAGETVRLVDLLSEAVERARGVIAARNPQTDNVEALARQVGIGSVKYADLATSRSQDYAFDPDRMVSWWATPACTCSTRMPGSAQSPRWRRRRGTSAADLAPPSGLWCCTWTPSARPSATWPASRAAPACTYLFGLAQAFTAFYEACPVVTAASGARARRIALCRLTGVTLATGLDLLGVAAPYPL
jgi:arginyl-tRNA synthetase